MTDYNDGKWYGWNGGPCPLHPKTLVEVRYDDQGNKPLGEHEAGSSNAVRWLHGFPGRHIIAFRVTKIYHEPIELWVNTISGTISRHKQPGMKLFREVRE
jgi:hypothetical protein